MSANPDRPDKPNTKYVIHIDRRKYEVDDSPQTGAEIRQLAGLGSEVDLYLEQRGNEDDRLIADDDPVELEQGMHFFSTPKYINPGQSDLLPDHDLEYLRSKGFDFDAQLEDSMISLIIKGFALPAGYQPSEVDLLLRLPVQFPQVPPDMFWTDPVVSYTNGGVPHQTQMRQTFMGRSWQRWSRHFRQSQWRPGTDDLRSYLRLIRSTLEREVSARAS